MRRINHSVVLKLYIEPYKNIPLNLLFAKFNHPSEVRLPTWLAMEPELNMH